jgi:hypothetical protein
MWTWMLGTISLGLTPGRVARAKRDDGKCKSKNGRVALDDGTYHKSELEEASSTN